MFKRFTKRLSTLAVVFMLALSTTPLANTNILAASDDTFTIVHTNDMHGRLNQKLDSGQTRLAALKNYIKEHDANLVLDAGDAIQGLPISNISEGKYMLDAMVEIGYDAMTIGNHEFDFGQDNLIDLKDQFDGTGDGKLRMLSNNVYKDGSTMFDHYGLFESDGKNVAIIGVTTPETYTKTHPNNIHEITFKDPYKQVKLDLDDLESNDLDLVIVLAHLGNDQDSEDADRGDILANKLSSLNYKHPILVIDGHSHSEIDPGIHYDNDVLYVQTGEYINNIGHVVIDFDNFGNSYGKLIKTDSIDKGSTTVLESELKASDAYDVIGGEVVIDNFELHLVSDREFSRTQETALGNLIADAVMAYGKTTVKPPHVAVINGGGIRADLKPGPITVGDIIAVLPFGNMYSSIEVSGQQLIDMFEHSYRNNPQLDENGKLQINEANNTYFIGANGGFLHIAGAVVEYDPFAEPYNKILNVYIEKPSIRSSDNLELVDPKGNYVLATNDFLAVGGDGYDMLSGVRVEGSGLDDVLIDFLKNDLVDFTVYEDQFPTTRILQKSFDQNTVDALNNLVRRVRQAIKDKEYPQERLYDILEVLDEIEAYNTDVANEERELFEHEIRDLMEKLEDAIKEPKPEPVEPEPVEPEPIDPDPVDPVDLDPIIPDKKPIVSDTDSTVKVKGAKVKDDLPLTGSVSLAYPASILVGLGLMVKAVSKRKED